MTRVSDKTIKIKDLAELKQDLVFLPNPNHRRAKAKFWARYSNLSGSQPSMKEVVELTNEPSVRKWWSLPGFKEWLLNEDEARERLEYLYMVALDAAEQVLLNPDSNDNAKVQMVKVIAQLAGKEPSKDKYVDDDIQKMDEAKLRSYIIKNAPKLLKDEGEQSEDGQDTGDSR